MRKIKSPFKYLFVMSIAFGIFGCQEQFSPLELDISDETSTDTDQTLIAGKASAAAERFIVIFDETVNNAAGERLIAATGGTLLKPLSVIHGNAVLLPAQAVAALRRTEGVALIEKDRIVSLPDPGIHGNGKGGGKTRQTAEK